MATRITAPVRRIEAEIDLGFHPEAMTRVHWAASGLAAVTGAVHVYLYLTQGFLPFLFAGVVFFAAILGMAMLPYGHLVRRAIYALGVPFTMGQIGAWVAVGMPDFALGVADKAVQIALIAVLVYLLATERKAR